MVVTIVVLLILAGISLNLVLGQSGIISRAQEAKNKTLEGQVNAEKAINSLTDEMNALIGQINSDSGNSSEDDNKSDGFVNGILMVDGTPYTGYWWYNAEDKVEKPTADMFLNGKYALYSNGKISIGWGIDNVFYNNGEIFTGVVMGIDHLDVTNSVKEGETMNTAPEFVAANTLVVNNGKRFNGYLYNTANSSEVINGLVQNDIYLCLAPTTEIEIVEEDEDGKKKRKKKKIKDVKVGDKVLSINPETGKLEEDIVIYADGEENKKHTESEKWIFSDGTELITVHKHRFYNIERQDFTYIQEWNMGEHGYTENGEIIELIGHETIKKEIQSCTIFTEKWNNYFANGVLTGNRKSIKMKIG